MEALMRIMVIALLCALAACGSLERRATALNPGDNKQAVLDLLGEPQDRQFSGGLEVWQYCKTGAGFGYPDFRIVWFRDGVVTGMTSYKDHTPASGCTGHFRSIDWGAAPQ
jgi:hypothetical protein